VFAENLSGSVDDCREDDQLQVRFNLYAATHQRTDLVDIETGLQLS
jgi:hypothetical protein